MATQTVETKPASERKVREIRSYNVRLDAPAGGEEMHVRAFRTKSGWRSEAVHRAGKKGTRGATQDHPTFDSARAAVDDAAARLAKLGWRVRVSPDFDGRGQTLGTL